MFVDRTGYIVVFGIALVLMAFARQQAGGGGISWAALLEGIGGALLFLWLALAVTRKQGAFASEVQPVGFRHLVRQLTTTPPGRAALLLLVSVASAVEAVNLNRTLPGASPQQWIAFALWAGSVIGFLAATWEVSVRGTGKSSAPAATPARRGDLLFLGLLTVSALLLRTVGRSDIPYPMSGDEASVGMQGLLVMSGKVTNMFGTGWSSQPNLSFLLPGILQSIFGADIDGLRLFPAVVGTLAIPIVYLLGMEAWDRRVGLLAAIFLAAYHYHIHFSRIAVNNIADATIFAAGFLFLLRALRLGRLFDYALAGVVAGIGLYSYAGGRILIVLVILVAIFHAVRERGDLRTPGVGPLAVVGGVVAAIFPMAIYFSQHLDEFSGRLGQVGMFQNGWFTAQLQQPGSTVVGIMMDRIWLSLFSFTYVPATSGFYNSPEPLLDAIAATCFIIGVAWSVWHWKQPRHLSLCLWFFAIIAGTSITVDLPNAARTVGAIPVVAIFVAIGLSLVSDVTALLLGLPRKAKNVGTAVVLLVMCVVSLRFYFLEYTPRYYFADANGEVAMEAGYYLRSLGPEYYAYFYGRPRMFINFPSLEYLRRDVKGEDGPPTLTADMISALPRDRSVVLIFIPQRASEAELVQGMRPEGRVLTFPRKTKNETLFIAIELPRPR